MRPAAEPRPASVFLYPGRRIEKEIRAALRHAGHRLLEPADEGEALSVLPEVRADLFVIEASGKPEAQAALRALGEDRAASEVPVLVLGGPDLREEDAVELYLAGAADVLPPGAGLPLLLARIEALLRLQRRLAAARELSVRDDLTGLYNRRYYFERLDQEIARAMRGRHGIGVVVFDVDHFKKINDTFGHPTGDVVLRQIAECARLNTRKSDVVARVGGDEFALLLASNSGDGSRVCAEGLRRRLAHTRFTLPPEVRVTVSIGVAAWPSALVHRPVEDLLRVADEALLRAKALGRDRVVLAGEA